ncbi:MAG: HD domain-containing protein [Anaerolineae bacterium]|nr:HD domain-containing protein [Anaerolineae bacterium]
MTGYSERYEAALALAACAHRQQTRKGSDVPYIVHPVHASVILMRYGFDEDLVIAALLHDVVEDQDISPPEIEARFGGRVAGIVAALTEQKYAGGMPRPWETRKAEALDHLRRAGPDAAAVKAADLLHSLRGLAAALLEHGPDVWQHFSRGPGPTLHFYRGVVAIIHDKLPGHPLAAEAAAAVDDLARAVEQPARPQGTASN